MKALFVFALAIWTTNTFGQIPINKPNGIIINLNKGLESDSSLKVVYVNKESNIKKPAYFLNEKLVNETLIGTLNPMLIDSIKVLKDSIQIGNIQYYGQIHIKTKSSYNPKLISLTDLKDKYTKLKNESVVFMIDGKIINADYDKYMVDESYLLTIIVDPIENSKENINIGLIKLLTKSKEIRIRGTEVVANK